MSVFDTCVSDNPLVEVLDIHPIPGAGNLHAFATVRVGPWILHSIRIVQQPGQRAWISLPQQQGRDGRWWPVLQCDDGELDRRVKAAVLEAWQEATS